MKSLLQKADRCYARAYFARVNWSACFLDMATTVVAACANELPENEFGKAYVSLLGSEARKGLYSEQKSEIWGDSISITLGQRPIPVTAVVPAKGKAHSLLSETRAALVFSQSVSGSVVAMIYPPSSDVARPKKDAYLVDFWADPSDVTKKQIKKLFRLFVEVDLFCGAAVYPNSTGLKLLAKLEAKDTVLANGGSRLWVWFKYAFRFTRGVLRLYGIGKPTPT